MCNPRRVIIQLARHIEEAWRKTVEQTATATGEVTETARLQVEIRLREEMGEAALQMFQRVLAGEFAGFAAWEQDAQGQYRHQVDEVTLVYHPATAQLTMETKLSQLVTSEARAAAEVCGSTTGEAAVEAVEHYYEDGWGGRTKERAQAEAQQEAEGRLGEAIEKLHRQQNPVAFAEAEAQAQAKAESEAARQLDQSQTEVRQALREQLSTRIAQAQENAYQVIHQAVGETYRQTLCQYVLDQGGRVLVDEQTGCVIQMELEL